MNGVLTQPSKSRLVHHEPLPAVNTEGMLGVPEYMKTTVRSVP